MCRIRSAAPDHTHLPSNLHFLRSTLSTPGRALAGQCLPPTSVGGVSGTRDSLPLFFRRISRASAGFAHGMARMPTPKSKRCLGCGYILDGLPEPRCPECGRSFDLSDVATYSTVAPRAGPGWACFVGALVGVTVNWTPFLGTIDRRAFPLLGLAGLAVQIAVILTSVALLRIWTPAHGSRAPVIAAAVMATLSLVGCCGITTVAMLTYRWID